MRLAITILATMMLGTFAQAQQKMQCEGVMINDEGKAYDTNLITISELNGSAVTLIINGEKLTGNRISKGNADVVEATSSKTGNKASFTADELEAGDEDVDTQFFKLTVESFDEDNQPEGNASGVLACKELN